MEIYSSNKSYEEDFKIDEAKIKEELSEAIAISKNRIIITEKIITCYKIYHILFLDMKLEYNDEKKIFHRKINNLLIDNGIYHEGIFLMNKEDEKCLVASFRIKIKGYNK